MYKNLINVLDLESIDEYSVLLNSCSHIMRIFSYLYAALTHTTAKTECPIYNL